MINTQNTIYKSKDLQWEVFMFFFPPHKKFFCCNVNNQAICVDKCLNDLKTNFSKMLYVKGLGNYEKLGIG